MKLLCIVLHQNLTHDNIGTPIIVVPAGLSDLFTMLNIKDFLEDEVYVDYFLLEI